MIAIEFTTETPEGTELTVTANVTPGLPAHTNCLPEDAYPEEAPDIEIQTVTLQLRNESYEITPTETLLTHLQDEAWETYCEGE